MFEGLVYRGKNKNTRSKTASESAAGMWAVFGEPRFFNVFDVKKWEFLRRAAKRAPQKSSDF